MSSNLDRASRFRRNRTRRRARAALGVLVFGLASALPMAAIAQCGSPVTVSTYGVGHAYFKCYRWCVIARRDAPVLANLTFRGPDGLNDCFRRCRDTAGCQTVSVQSRFEMVDGARVGVWYCTLYGAGEMPIASAYDVPRHIPGTSYYVCYPVPPPGRQPWHDATPPDKFQQDQYRPGVPGPSAPKK